MRSTPSVLVLAALLVAVAGCQETSSTSSSTTSGSAGGAATRSAPAASAETTPVPAATDLTAADKTMEVVLPGSGPATIRYTDLKIGDGSIADAGKVAMVHYTGKLTDGTTFDSSLERQPLQFRIGDVPPAVIEGWDKGLRGMRVGGKRKLVIPPALGYGARGYPGAIPPNATLVFEVELVGLQ